MANTKLYYLSQLDFVNHIKNAKMPPQQIQIYAALADLGVPTRGADAVTHAEKKFNLITRQPHDVLAAWYFSKKRRPLAYVIEGEPTPVIVEDLPSKITRLTDEIEAKQTELKAAESEWLEQMANEQAEVMKNEELDSGEEPAEDAETTETIEEIEKIAKEAESDAA